MISLSSPWKDKPPGRISFILPFHAQQQHAPKPKRRYGFCKSPAVVFVTALAIVGHFFLNLSTGNFMYTIDLLDSNVFAWIGGFKSASTNTGDYQCGEDEIPTSTYVVCNGLSNQLAGHAGYIAGLIKSGEKVAIPDAFIFNGVQNEQDGEGQTLKNVFARKDNSIPLASIIDADALLARIRRHGVDACFIPHETVIRMHEDDAMATAQCSWLEQLKQSDDDIELEVLDAMKPSAGVSGIVKSILSNIQDKSPGVSLSDGVCLHHRDGADWHKHCSLWQGNNCINADNMAIEDLVKHRLPAMYPKKFMYYVGDANPSDMLIESIEKHTNIELLHREKDGLVSNDKISDLLGNNEILSVEKFRDVFAAIDFFVCQSMPSFIGNSVSTFSAVQIALRRGKQSSWYNSRNIPLLADFLRTNVSPIVYTYTEESEKMGKVLLKASITSVQQTFGPEVEINVIYHGTEDRMFLNWLSAHQVIVHMHQPQWVGMIEDMIRYADHRKSHLYAHPGNYLGTWQRIDIPLFINAEYALLLDADTIVRSKFDLASFGLDITPGLAFSLESDENNKIPFNAGVGLLNVPKLRETYADFLAFIQDHVSKKKDFVLSPSDQGAYLDFYTSYKNPSRVLKRGVSTYIHYLDEVFNVKPYFKSKRTFEKRKIVHFHGLKPLDILKGYMGYDKGSFPQATHFLLPRMFGGDTQLLCLTLRDFAQSLVDDVDNFTQFCSIGFSSNTKEQADCKKFLLDLSKRPEDKDLDCDAVMKLYGYSRDASLFPTRVVPFSAFKVDEAGDTHHRSCRRTIIVHGKKKRSYQPFEELTMGDISDIPSVGDDILCLQVGSSVGALVTSNEPAAPIIIGSDTAEEIVHQLKKEMAIEESAGIEFEIADRKSIAMSVWYQPSTQAVRLARSLDQNSGNFVWEFGATRLINPYTTNFVSPEDAIHKSIDVDALVLASANALYLPEDGNNYQVMKNHVNQFSRFVERINKPTVLIGIGIQAEFSDVKDTKQIALHEHQAKLMTEIAKRNSLEKSVSVRGAFTETACINAGVHNCLSLGCPSLSISRERSLGQVLESKWNDVQSKLAHENIKLQIGIGLPALLKDSVKYAKIVDLLLAVCKNHECHFLVQAPYDKDLLLKHAGDKVDAKNVRHFTEGVEDWFLFMKKLDFVVSTRIHGGMAGIANGIPTIIIPTDLRILELVDAMKLPHISFSDAMNKKFETLRTLMDATTKDFIDFEQNRRNRIRVYKRLLESVGLKMDPLLLDVISEG